MPRHRDLNARLLLAAVLIASAVLVLLRRPIAHSIIYMPSHPRPSDAMPARWALSDADTVWFSTADGARLFGWWIKARPTRPTCGAAIVYYGNKGNLVARRHLGAALAARGLDVLLFDYRGFGQSPGTPSEQSFRADGWAAYDYVRREGGVPPDRILLVAHSLGTAVAVDVAVKATVGGIVLLAPFTSLDGAVRARLGWFPASLLPDGERFSSLELAGKVRAPALVALGERDQLVPRSDAARLYDLLGGAKEWMLVSGVGHNDLASSTAFWSRVEQFGGKALGCALAGR